MLSCTPGISVTHSLLGLSYRRLRCVHASPRRGAALIVSVFVLGNLF
jgi:hypothetical protein